MDSNLHSILKSNILKSIHLKYISYQLFKVLKYIHSAELIHRDLKPTNVLINRECIIKLTDFGLAKLINNDGVFSDLTSYVSIRWYRAPEILLGSTQYSKAVDIWSVGCILAEMFLNKTLFPGNSTLNQIELILQFTGWPNQNQISKNLINLKIRFIALWLRVFWRMLHIKNQLI